MRKSPFFQRIEEDMFLTIDQYRHPLSSIMGKSDAQIWQAVEVELQSPWYLVELEVAGTDGTAKHVRTLLLSRIKDVIDLSQAVVTSRGHVVGVAMISANVVKQSGGWKMQPLVRIWSAQEPSDPRIEAWICEKSDGTLRVDSIFDTPVDELSSWQLVVSI